VKTAFTELAPVFEHFGITVTCKGKRDPVWTLKGHGRIARVTADGSVDVITESERKR
jgi:hypothetical protein